jgi:hypothetical protein
MFCLQVMLQKPFEETEVSHDSPQNESDSAC